MTREFFYHTNALFCYESGIIVSDSDMPNFLNFYFILLVYRIDYLFLLIQ